MIRSDHLLHSDFEDARMVHRLFKKIEGLGNEMLPDLFC